jgi:hypothetical protein
VRWERQRRRRRTSNIFNSALSHPLIFSLTCSIQTHQKLQSMTQRTEGTRLAEG